MAISGGGGSTATYGIRVKVAVRHETMAGEQVNPVTCYIERTVGAVTPTTTTITIAAWTKSFLPSTSFTYDDILADDGRRRWYRAWHDWYGYTASAKTGWVSAKPSKLYQV